MIALSAVASSALAGRNAIDVRVRLAGETAWLDSLDYVGIPGAGGAHIEVAVFYERSFGYGFAGAMHNVVTTGWDAAIDVPMLLDRSDSSQHPDGRQGQFNFPPQRQSAYTTGADLGTLRIATANNTQNALGGGIDVFQRSPLGGGTNFDASNPALGFRFDLLLGERGLGIQTTYSLDTQRVASFRVYADENSTTGVPPFLPPEIDGAVIRTVWIPAPGTAGIFAIASSLWLRRRR